MNFSTVVSDMHNRSLPARNIKHSHGALGSVRVGSICAGLLTIAITIYLLSMDRAQLIDNDNYINYFRFSGFNYWTDIFSWQGDSFLFFSRFFTEEVGWRFWVMVQTVRP